MKKKPMKKNLRTDILEQSSGCGTPEMVQLEDSEKAKTTPQILFVNFFFYYFFFFSFSS